MKSLIKKMFMFTSILGVAVIMAACSNCDSKKPMHKNMEHGRMYSNDDMRGVAKIYTHSRAGGQAKMGYIKFHDTDAGMKMSVDLKDMRPGVAYNVVAYGQSECNDMDKSCQMKKMDWNLPMLKAGMSGELKETYMIPGLTCAHLKNTTVTLQRDGGYKAAWGKIETGKMKM